MASPCRLPPSPPALLPELIEEILLRVPPDKPAHLVRAALVCKPWHEIISDRQFLRRYSRYHRSPPLLGYIHNFCHNEEGPVPPFVPTTVASPLSPLALDRSSWLVLDCRHGRVLILANNPECIIIWNPITDEQKKLSVPPYPYTYCTAAVLCAMDGCDHLDCHGGPFLVVFVGTNFEDPSYGPLTWASMYSSETSVWSASIDFCVLNFIDTKPGLLIGDALYFTLKWGLSIVMYDLGGHKITEIEPPPDVYGSIIAMEVEDGALGLVGELDNCIYKWLWQPSANGTGRWAQQMVLDLETLLPRLGIRTSYGVIGVMEGTDTIFINGDAGVFTLDLKSGKAKRVGKSGAYSVILPYMSFYTLDLVKGTVMRMQ